MALITAEEFKKNKGQTVSSSTSPSTGLITAEEFKKQKAQERTDAVMNTVSSVQSAASAIGDYFRGVGDSIRQGAQERLAQQSQQNAAAAKNFADTQTLIGLTRTQPETPPIEKPMIARMNESIAQNRQSQEEQMRERLRAGEVSISDVARVPNETLGGNLQRVGESLQRFDTGLQDALTFGITSALDRRIAESANSLELREMMQERLAGLDSPEAKVGGFVGTTLGGAGAYGLIGNLGRSIAQPLLRTGVRGAAAGALYGAAGEAADIALDTRQDGANTIGQRLGNVALEAALGGALDVGLEAVGKGVIEALKQLRNRKGAPVEAIDEILALPEPRQRGRANTAVTPDVIEAGMPATRATIRRETNPYREKYEQLIAEASQREFRPGYELEELESLWSQMAGPDDPDLMTLIDLAYPRQTRKVDPDLARRAREYQQSRLAAGVPLPVRTISDRMPQTPLRRTETVSDGVSGTSDTNMPIRSEMSSTGQLSSLRTVDEDGIPKGVFPDPEPTPAKPVQQTWFEKLFGTQPLGITSRLASRGRNLLTTEGQIVDSPIKRDAKGAIDAATSAARKSYYEFVDMNAPIKRISPKAYEQSMDARRANQIANVIVTDKFVNPQGQVIGQGLKEIVRKAGRGNYNAFTDYLIARHALTRMSRGEKVYADHLKMTPEKVAERIRTLEQRYPGFAAIANEWDQYFKNIREVYGVEEGLISRDLANYLESHNPTYAPMRRQFSQSEKIKGLTYSGAKPAFSGQKAPIKEVSPTGSARKIVDPVRSTIEQTGAWVNAAMRNRVMQSVVDAIRRNPENMRGIAEIVQPKSGQKNLKEILMKDGEEAFLEALQDDFNKLFSKQRLDQDNIVRAMINGEPVYVKVHDPEALKALLGMGAEQSNIVLNIMTNLSNLVKQGATGALAPLFAAKGATMDVAQAFIQAENPLAHAGYLMSAIVSSIADALRIPGLRDMAQAYYRAGGGYSAALRGERNLRRSVSDIRLDPLLSPRTIGRAVGKTVLAPYKLSLKVSDIAENVNRIAAYHYKLRQLGGEPTPDNVREAMNYAREITTNWSRRGRQSQMLESMIPYNNAAIQGLYRFGRTWKQNPVKTTALVGLGILVPKFYEYMQFHDDPDYQKLTAREKYRNLIVSKNEDGTFVKIPLSPEWNALGALMVDFLEAYKDGDPEAFKGATDALVDAFTPPIISGAAQGIAQGGGIEQSMWGVANATAVGPILGAMGNQSFTGAPIEPLRVQDRSPQYRYDERTTSVARWLGEQTGWSPMKIDYVIRSYGGDPARLLLPLTSDYGGGTARNTVLRNFIVDPEFTNTLSDDFYRAKDMLNNAYRDYQEAGAPLPEWYNDEVRRALTSQAQGSISKVLSQLNQMKREINADKSLSAQEKSQRTREIQQQINEIYINVNSQLRELGIPILNR